MPLPVFWLILVLNYAHTEKSFKILPTRTCVYQGVRNVSLLENFADEP